MWRPSNANSQLVTPSDLTAGHNQHCSLSFLFPFSSHSWHHHITYTYTIFPSLLFYMYAIWTRMHTMIPNNMTPGVRRIRIKYSSLDYADSRSATCLYELVRKSYPIRILVREFPQSFQQSDRLQLSWSTQWWWDIGRPIDHRHWWRSSRWSTWWREYDGKCCQWDHHR